MANITKRGSSYLIRVSEGYDNTGKKLYKSMTWRPDPKLTPKQIEKELNKVTVQFEERVKSGLESNDPKLTFAQFTKQYLEIKKDVLSPRTYEDYIATIEKIINPKIGHLKLSCIRPVHIQDFVKYLSETPPTVKYVNGVTVTLNKKRSPARVKRILSVVQSILTQAVKLDIIPANPADSKKLTLPKSTTPKVEIFTKQEAAQMLECLENEPLQYRVMIQLAIMTGARRGELAALKFSDIDRNTNKITIERSAVKLKNKPVMTKPPKDYEVRQVTIPAYCIDMIDELKAEKQIEAEKLGDLWKEGDWIFTQWNGEIIHPDTLTQWFTKFLKKYGLKHRKFHSLRHTSATLLLYGGASIRQVQGRLGHGDVSTTNKYLHYIAEADSESANILQNMLITHKTNDISDKEIKQA